MRVLPRNPNKRRALVATILLVAGVISLIIFSLYILQGIIGGFVIGFSTLFGVIALISMHPAKASKLLSRIYKLVSTIYSRADRNFVSADIEGVINSYSTAQLGFETGNGVEIEWVKDIDKDSFLEEDRVIIRLDQGSRQPENLARASMEYAKKGVIPDARPYINNNVNKGLNFCISQDILESDGQESARRILWNDYIMPNLSSPDGKVDTSKPVTAAYYGIDDTRQGGLLGSVLLNEYKKLVGYGRPDRGIQDETVDFLGFLKRIANKERKQDVPLKFEGGEINVQIVLAARSYATRTKPYVDRCKKGLASFDTTYLLAVGQNIELAEKAAAQICELPGVDEFDEVYHTLDPDSKFGGEKEAYYAKFESIKQNW